ncbi:alpha/beta hydrolase [Crenobacter sp. SG2305]|uniref:alpha/beta fold hydrolase n=1 Tax=Crenobacter oryzisoli TaxID=3056844 RepID=UPI0025AAACD1|nr:alpha/beta hydrolase [Crenobacter sp. SG2305]MDN0082267.1 alpha/beta hydrolase [Crenobacter sp. SG2305]
MPYTTHRGHRLYYEESGRGEHPLLLLNGLTMSTAGWTLLLPRLEARYRLVRTDLLGQGQSDKPLGDAYSLPEQAKLVAHLLDTLEVERCHVVGLSYGGMVAQHLAHLHPERIDHLVLAATLACSDAVDKAIAASWVAAAKSGGTELRFAVSLPWLFSNRYLSSHPEQISELKTVATLFDWDAVLRLLAGMREHDARTWLPTISAPTRVIVGSEDRLTPLHQSEMLSTYMPHAQLVPIPGAGHALHLESAEQFARLVMEFCPG